MPTKEDQNSQIITCKLGCINFYVKSPGDYCFGQGLFPIKICEGNKCVRGYTKTEMEEILKQERLEDERLKQQGLALIINT